MLRITKLYIKVILKDYNITLYKVESIFFFKYVNCKLENVTKNKNTKKKKNC